MFCVKLNGAVTASVNPVALTLLVLLIVAVCAMLAWPSVASVNVICAGLTFSPDAATPAPLNATVTAFTPSVEEVTVSVAVFAPVAAGVKITCDRATAPVVQYGSARRCTGRKTPRALTSNLQTPHWPSPIRRYCSPSSVRGELATPTCCVGKLKLVGLTVNVAALRPVPLRATVCVFSESMTFSAPICDPAAVGTNTTLKEQLEFPASWPPQLLVTWNGPLAEIAIPFKARSPLLVNVTGCAAESAPIAVPGKVNDVGESVSVGGAAPVPVNCTVCVPPASTSVSVPVAAPVCDGANSTVNWQSLFAASEVPHALLASTNGAVTVALVMGTAVDGVILQRHLQRSRSRPRLHLPKTQRRRRSVARRRNSRPFHSESPQSLRPPHSR